MSEAVEYLKDTARRFREKYRSEGIVYILQKAPITVSHFLDAVVIDLRSRFSDYSKKEVEYAHKSGQKLEKFTEDNEASELLYDLIETHSEKEIESMSALEIGCNAGRRANYLFQSGLTDIAGVDINPEVRELMEETFPELAAAIRMETGPAQEALRRFDDGEFDVVYTVSVLMHVRSKEDQLFDEMSRVTDDLIITLECENSAHVIEKAGIDERQEDWHEERNYREVFEDRGFEQVEVFHSWDDDHRSPKLGVLRHHGLNDVHTARVLRKR